MKKDKKKWFWACDKSNGSGMDLELCGARSRAHLTKASVEKAAAKHSCKWHMRHGNGVYVWSQ